MTPAPHPPEPSRPLGRVWLVANRASRSTDDGRIAALETALADAGATIAGNTDFPRQPAPDAAALADIDTLVVMGGDGTLGAAGAAARGWDGQFLAIPGGTMNLLPKALHGDAAPEAIVAAAAACQLVHVPVVRAGEHTSFCRIIIGPMTRWALARENARHGRLWRVLQAVRLALARGFMGGVRVAGQPGRHPGVLIMPGDDGLEVALFSGRGLVDAMTVAVSWLVSDWRDAASVTAFAAGELAVGRRRPLRCLFDGELRHLSPPARFVAGWSDLRYIRTRA
ncbi:diacylglycerol kinase family protein [Sandarakinorhabdus oryzae]|uniref:diacylglycerol kinase family protein n=1 Tax=Sandarakinorhabdus oryzae TaxID=2675220 RepID=UPI0012E29DE3|nr:diacylglycerol kinase family protein [Sandarakinorhabdus oryzae]